MFDFMVWLQQFRSPILDYFVEFITITAEETTLVVVLCILLWCFDRNKGYKIALSIILCGATNAIIKLLFHIERPWLKDDRLIPIRQETATSFSFPSGHTQSGGALWISLYMVYKNKILQVICILMILLIPFSRIYLSVHTPLDVLFGVIFAIIFTLIAHKIMNYVYEKNNMFPLIILAGLSVIALFFFKIDSYYKMAGLLVSFPFAYYLQNKFINYDNKSIWYKQVLKIVLGLGLTLGIKSGLKMIFPDQIIFDFIRYICVGFTVICFMPWLFIKIRLSKLIK